MLIESLRREMLARWIILPALFAIFLLLGYLQYRWSEEVSEAVTERTRRSMTEVAERIRADFHTELSRPCEALRLESAASLQEVRDRIVNRFRSASRAGALKAVGAVYLATPSRGEYIPELVTD